MPARSLPTYEFHVARPARDLYQFDQTLYSLSGNVLFADFYAARVFAQKMNAKRDLLRSPERAVRASQLNAMALIDEVLHLIVAQYRQEHPEVMSEMLNFVETVVGDDDVDLTLRRFGERFPPAAVYRRELELDAYLAGASEGLSHRQIQSEELLMLWLANMNPAFAPYLELFDDGELEQRSAYLRMIAGMREYFGNQPGFGPARDQNLIDVLRAPALASPHSLEGQLEFIRARWGRMLGSAFYRLLSSLDFIAEEQKSVFLGGPGPIQIPSFAGQAFEPEHYSADLVWMPRVVLLAKNAYVWLDQLSKRYGRAITRLSEVPDEELDRLADWGITGLWLIGLWERSRASQRIKQIMGNPDAVASAYSLLDYVIAADLGGPDAMDDLRRRAWQRGIRMASDMVPNHMGIDSNWVMEHPDWFLQLPYSPYPAYSFNGPDLSHDPDVGVFLEDHYYTRSDAAVVFKRVDYASGHERFIYHGNDGTAMPWNDTAQLDYLKAEVREAVIQTIIHVARQFPIIRFDAAMTLAKRHVQRLWFPEPGSGGAIPSRAEHGMSRDAFDAAMPHEFWREVVDRVAVEAPDTLLLAEAFWLLEGYFVRTLGMHRVYNSAFMHMLRDEDNAKYRQQIRTTLEFDPEILKRYVNFMSNPDEETAVEQFGKADKYFGVCTVMATVPGLPMFGHGQFEGYAEKYGMEYRRAYRDEHPDRALIERHEREISPLLHRRYLFAEVRDFRLYDFITPDGHVNENVLAYSNRAGDERGLVVYHNVWGETRGWVRTSVAFAVKGGDDKSLVQQNLGEGLALPADPHSFVIFRDVVSGLEYIRNTRVLHEQGLYVELSAYQRHVFLDFRLVYDDARQRYAQLESYLSGRGVPNIEEALTEIILRPLHVSFRELVNADVFGELLALRADGSSEDGEAGVSAWGEQHIARLDEIEGAVLRLLNEISALVERDGSAPDLPALAAEIRRQLEIVLQLPARAGAIAFLQTTLAEQPALWHGLFAWVFTHSLGKVQSVEHFDERSRSWLDQWLLARSMTDAFIELGISHDEARSIAALVKVLVSRQGWFAPETLTSALADVPATHLPAFALNLLLNDSEVQALIGVNRYGGVLWYTREAFATLLSWLFAEAVVVQSAAAEDNAAIDRLDALAEALLAANDAAEYQVEKLLDLAKVPE